MIDSIVVHPTARGEDYDISVYGRLAAILGVDLFPTARSNEEILATEGIPNLDSGKRALSGISRQNANQCLKKLEKQGLLRAGVWWRDGHRPRAIAQLWRVTEIRSSSRDVTEGAGPGVPNMLIPIDFGIRLRGGRMLWPAPRVALPFGRPGALLE